MPLAPLPPATVKLIGSGQVITSVPSVVKELMENSIDAGAQHIEIKLEKHGLEKIEIKDDGCGISKSDAAVMCLSSYTSKISDFTDLDRLSSYGFRGEALSALCSVATVSVTTKTADDDVATCYTFDHNGQVTCSKTSHLTKGTIVTVTELFRKLPVRKQFMSNSKRAAEELKRLEKLVKSLAVIHPRLRVTLVHNKFLCWQKTSAANLRQSVMQVVSLSVAKQLHHILHNTEQIRVEMLVPKSDCNVSSLCYSNFSDAHFLFINQRPVRNKELEKVVYDRLFEHFGVYTPANKYPLCVTCLRVPPDSLDVNLEPNKTRVYLNNQDDVLDIIKQCMLLYYGNGNNHKEFEEESVTKPVKKRKVELDVLEVDAHKEPLLKTNEELVVENQATSRDNAKDRNWDTAFEKFCLERDLSIKEATTLKTISKTVDSTDVEQQIKCSNVVSLSSNYVVQPQLSQTCTNGVGLNSNIPEDENCMENSEEYSESYVDCEDFKVSDEYEALVVKPPVGGPPPQLPVQKQNDEYSKSPPKTKHLVNSILLDSEEHSPSTTIDSGKGSQGNSPPTLSQWSRGEITTSFGSLVKGSSVLTSTSSPQDSQSRSVASQMGCKEMSAFTRFARNMRKQILEENPHMSFTRVAQQLQVKWRQLDIDEKRKYEESVLSKRTPSSPGQKQKTLVDMLAQDTPRIVLDINLSSLKQMVKCTTRAEVEREGSCLVSQLEASPLWLYSGPHSTVSVASTPRLMEAVKFHQHLTNYALPTRLLDSYIKFYPSDVGEESWNLLTSLERSPNGIVKDQVIIKNGFVVEIVEGKMEAHLTYVPQHVSHCGVEDLRELLSLLLTYGPQTTLHQCRPLKIISFLRSQVMRECSSEEPPSEFGQVSQLLSYWLEHVSPRTHNCIHHRPVARTLSC